MQRLQQPPARAARPPLATRAALALVRDFRKHKTLYLLFLPILLYFILFCYWPMSGVIIAFKDYKPRLGIMDSAWVGLDNFREFFTSPFFGRIIRNTVLLNFYNLLAGFPAPILFAVLLNEVRHTMFKRTVQTVTYLPHFITTVITASIIIQFTNAEGFVTWLYNNATGHTGALISDANLFRSIYVISEVWQTFGWNSIIYLAAMTAIGPELYEAARIDGAGKLKQIRHITLPGIMPTVIIMFILACGKLMSLGWEKAFLLQTPLTFETAEIISTYVYKKGFEELNFSYSAAVDFFNAVINLVLLTAANQMSKRYGEGGLW